MLTDHVRELVYRVETVEEVLKVAERLVRRLLVAVDVQIGSALAVQLAQQVLEVTVRVVGGSVFCRGG
jgi:hypothetical protein